MVSLLSLQKVPQVETDSDTPLSIQHRLEILRPPTLVRTYWIEVLEIKHENKRHPSRKQQYITIYCWWKMSKTTLRSWSVMEVYAPLPKISSNVTICEIWYVKYSWPNTNNHNMHLQSIQPARAMIIMIIMIKFDYTDKNNKNLQSIPPSEGTNNSNQDKNW